MGEQYKLRKIPLDLYDECDYLENKEMYYDDFNRFLNEGCTVRQAVNGAYYHGYDQLMNENGMDKFVAMLSGMLFMIEHNDVESAQAFGTNLDIADFETGEYDYLFKSDDLKLIKSDILIIKKYLSNHPELLSL